MVLLLVFDFEISDLGCDFGNLALCFINLLKRAFLFCLEIFSFIKFLFRGTREQMLRVSAEQARR